MKHFGFAALAATLALTSTAAISQSAQGEERRTVFIEADLCAIAIFPNPWDGGFYLAFGENLRGLHNSGGATNIQCRTDTLVFGSSPTTTQRFDGTCGYLDDGGDDDPSNDRTWEGTSRVTVNPDGTSISKCNLNRKDEVPFVEFPQ